MSAKRAITPLAAISLSGVAAFAVAGAISCKASAAGESPRFPEGFEKGVRYAVVNRGNIKEEIYTSQEAITAVKAGQPVPSGTVITMVDSRDSQLFRYIVMEKRSGWGTDFPPDLRTDDWKFQWFNPDRTVKAGEDLGRCMGCHRPQAANDFAFTLGRMKAASP